MATRSPTSFLHRLRRGLWGMLLPCVAVALLGMASTLNSNDSIDELATGVVEDYGAVSTVRDELGELLAIGQAGLSGDVVPGAPTFDEQLVVVLAAFDDAAAVLEPDEVASLTKARQHLMNVLSQSAALTTGELDLAEFRASADAEALEAFRDLDAIYQVGAAEFVDETAAVSNRTNQILGLVGIVVIAAVAASIVLVRRLRNALYRPLRELEVGLEQFAIDGLGHRIEVDGDREFRSVAAVVNTMAAQLDESLAELAHRAFHDPLTDLANRAQLERRLTRQLDPPRRSSVRSGGSGRPTGAVVVLDLDGFKAVNDALGHQAGDEVLVEVAQRLRAAVRPADLVARLGGDEFAILLADARGRADVDAVVSRVSAAISVPIMVAGRAIVLDCSAGAQLVRDGSSPLDLLRHADIALYAAKRDGRGRLLQFEPEMEAVVRHRLELEAELRVAMSSDQIEVVYQPIMDLVDPHVAGFEALARWNHPERGVVGPDEFIPIAEATGLIIPLGRAVLNAACDQLAKWRGRVGHERLLLGVNVSPSQLQDSGFIDNVRTALAASRIPPSALVLEITETVMADPRAVACIHELKHLGVAVALDDFGTGYSSLSYLQQLPIDILKIDKSFIDHIDTNPDRAVLVNSVLRMGRALGLRTVAEGIEDAAQLELLQQLGCQRGQGFYVSAPMPAAAVEQFLAESLSIDCARNARTGARDLVLMRIPTLPTRFALAWTAYATQVVARFEGAEDLPGGVSGGMLSVMRHYIATWRRAADSAGPSFTWVGLERASVLRVLAADWGRITERAAVGDGAIAVPTDAEPFHNAVANAVLVALAATEAEPCDDAAHLLHVWLDQNNRQHELASTTT